MSLEYLLFIFRFDTHPGGTLVGVTTSGPGVTTGIVLHKVGSSSEPSIQSSFPSHFPLLLMQAP